MGWVVRLNVDVFKIGADIIKESFLTDKEFETLLFATDDEFIIVSFSTDDEFETVLLETDEEFETLLFATDEEFETAFFATDKEFETLLFATDDEFEIVLLETDDEFEIVVFSTDEEFEIAPLTFTFFALCFLGCFIPPASSNIFLNLSAKPLRHLACRSFRAFVNISGVFSISRNLKVLNINHFPHLYICNKLTTSPESYLDQ
jgi:hypothetical protein